MSYETKYDHDAYKLDLADITPINKLSERQKLYSSLVKNYNEAFKMFKGGDRSTKILKHLDKMQGLINDQTDKRKTKK